MGSGKGESCTEGRFHTKGRPWEKAEAVGRGGGVGDGTGTLSLLPQGSVSN